MILVVVVDVMFVKVVFVWRTLLQSREELREPRDSRIDMVVSWTYIYTKWNEYFIEMFKG